MYMKSTINDLYLYDDIRRLLLCDDQITCLDTDNGPMNRREIKVHKGLDNTLKFRVFDPDRNPVNICNYQLFGRLFNTENRELVLEKPCRTTTAKGMVFLDLNEGDIANIAKGLYDLVIVGQKDFVPGVIGESTTTPFYSDFVNNIVQTVLITDQAERVPRPSYIIGETDWTMQRVRAENSPSAIIDQFYSSTIPANRVQNHINGTHSFSVYTDQDNKFTGTLEILGTLDQNPQSDPSTDHWFNIEVVTGSQDLEFINFFGTDAFTFNANVMFLKFRYTPSVEVENPGLLKKIIVRS